jgi:RNA polymerase sporulation-specific sigma factor
VWEEKMNIIVLILRFIGLALGLEGKEEFPPALSKRKEEELFKKMKEGSKEAREKIIEHNLRLVAHIIRKYYSSYSDTDELISIGSLGLIKAVDSFKSELGTRFATYGARCIQNEILMFFRSQKRRSAEVSLSETIDVDRDGNPLTYLDIISEENTAQRDIEMGAYIKKMRHLIDICLDQREKEIITLRYGLDGYLPRAQREVAKYLGISRSYVSRIEKSALEKLKINFGSDVPEFD